MGDTLIIPPSTMWAFIDEYGNTDLATEKPGATQLFIVAAILVRQSEIDPLRDGVEAVRMRHFQTGEMKSSKLGSDRRRWADVLTALAPLPFRFYGLAVDKAAVDKSSGLHWKKSFYKNLCGRAYNKLMRAFGDLRVRADQHGYAAFMRSFARYIEAEHRPTLFDRGTFEFVESKSEVLVQLADIMAGVLARAYDPKMLLAKPEELLALVSDHALLVDEWPLRYRVRSGSGEIAETDSVDERIGRLSMSLAEEYIEKFGDTQDPDLMARVAVLERLLFERRFTEASRPVATGALMANLRERGLIAQADETWLRRNVIAPLRDARVLITSSPLGYKLPEKRSDLEGFVHHAESVCIPMIKRVKSACDSVKLATEGDVDVLSDKEFVPISRMIGALEGVPDVPEPEEP